MNLHVLYKDQLLDLQGYIMFSLTHLYTMPPNIYLKETESIAYCLLLIMIIVLSKFITDTILDKDHFVHTSLIKNWCYVCLNIK